MMDWLPIECAAPEDGDCALILAEVETGRGTIVGLWPQLCKWSAIEHKWVQMLSGDYYECDVEGTPLKFMPVHL